MSNEGRIVSPPNAFELGCLLESNGISETKWWEDNKKNNNQELNLLLLCYRQTTSSRRFNKTVHKQIVKKKLDRYFLNLKKAKPYLKKEA